MKKVFIIYSHKDKDWVRGWLLPRLESAGISVHIDFRDFEIGVPSVLNMERAVEKCEKTILILNSNWLQSEWTRFEGFMLQTEDPIGLRGRILPLMLDHSELPLRLRMLTYADFRDKNDWDFQIGRVIKQVEKDFAEVEEPAVKFQALAAENINIDGLPKTGYELFGRQKELKILNEAWESGNTNVLSFVAYGGTGKSTLVNKWLEKMRWDNYRRAEKVFGWSFYSQGTKERATSADKFITEALAWFGDPDPKKGSPWDKGQRLADLIRKKKTLLILDGLEPLQSAFDFERGKIKDPALSILVTQLARKNNGLCVITTREKVAELARFDKGVKQLNLEQISKDAGRALLRVGGVQGTDIELEAASEEFGNHALAVNLMASYIHDIPGHHISNTAQIEDLDIPEENGKHPRRVIEAFEKRFGEGPEVQILRILGLFDRPVEMDAIKAVYNGAPIAILTDKLVNLTETQWQNLLKELRGYKLLAKESTHCPDIVDCHPLIREHFGEKLKKNKPKAWKEAHGRLYEYYKGLPEKLYGKFLPDTLEEMEPLFSAVSHGCQTGKYQEALDDIFNKRMDRGKTFAGKQLGAIGAVLACLAGFFESRWSQVTLGLRERSRAYILNVTGFCLRALGRLTEAEEPIRVATEIAVKKEDWRNAASGAGTLSEFYLTLGDIKEAVDYGKQCIDFIDKTEESLRKAAYRGRLANALHQAGNAKRSEQIFRTAEEMQKRDQPEYPYLYSQRGFQYCDLLLSVGQYREVQKRSRRGLEIVLAGSRNLLDIALNKLSLGLAYMLEAVSEGKSKKAKGKSTEWKPESLSLKKAADFLNQAVDGLREFGHQEFIVRGLLSRGELYRYQKSGEKAWADLEEAKEIAERGQMNLYMADYHLEAARLSLAESENSEYRISNTECRMTKLTEARTHCEEAAKRVNDMGYHRRDPEVLLIQAEFLLNEDNKKLAQETLKTAEMRINEMGCHRWDIEVKRLENSF